MHYAKPILESMGFERVVPLQEGYGEVSLYRANPRPPRPAPDVLAYRGAPCVGRGAVPCGRAVRQPAPMRSPATVPALAQLVDLGFETSG